MNHRKSGRLLALTALLTAALLLFSGCTAEEGQEEGSVPASGEVISTPVSVQTVARGPLQASARLSGRVTSSSEVSVMAPMGGKVTAVYVEVGDTVANGQTLFSLDKSDLWNNLNSLEAERTRTIALLEAQVSQARTNYENTKALFAIGAASQLELDGAEVTLLSAETSMASTIQTFDDNLRTLRDTLADCDVKAPVAGRVSSLLVTVGATASPAAPSAVISEGGGDPVTVSVSETVQPYLTVGGTAEVLISTLSPEPVTATIKTISPTAAQQTRLFDVVLTLPAGLDATGGMFATVTFATEQRQDAVLIPTECILNDGLTQTVYLVEDGRAASRTVTTGLVGDGVTEITSGLEGGETLVIVGQSYLTEGAAVRIVEGA